MTASLDKEQHGSGQRDGAEMDQHRMDRVGLLSPLEESSAEISRDSGVVSQSTSSLSMVSEILSSGTVSQSPSFGAAANVPQSPSLNGGQEPGTAEPGFAEQDEEVLRHTALGYSSYMRVTAGEEVRVLEALSSHWRLRRS